MEDHSPQMKQNRAARRAAAKTRALRNNGNKTTSSGTRSKQSDAQISVAGGATRVKHREFIRDVAGSVAFGTNSLPVNPGMSQTFPWLSSIAERFESYLFQSLKFDYMHQVSEFTEGNGKILLAVDYDAADAAPTSKIQMAAYASEVSCAPYENVSMICKKSDLDKFGKQRYIRTGSLASNLDVKTYDVGQFFVATQGQADSDPVGELYVEYDVLLFTPQLNMAPLSSKIVGTGAKTAVFSTSAVTGSLPITVNSSNTITFNRPGQYMLTTLLTGTGLTALAFTASTGATSSQAAEIALASGLYLMACDIVTITLPGQALVVDAATGNTTVTATEIRISQYEYALG